MLIKAEQRNSRQSSRKVRLVANAVKSLPIEQAMTQLGLMDQKGSIVVMKVLHQAVANATKNHGVAVADLSIKEILVNEGPRYKRFRAVSRGRAHNIIKKTCHVKVVLEASTAPVAAAAEAPQVEAVKTPVKATPKKRVAAVKPAKTEKKAPVKKSTKVAPTE